ncbi:MAG: ABC transporter substrate-binding protein [Gemmatimonadota bacterium]|nr:ABC transporter substrate-binding protein [Gemmatimonadota bacterium]
MHSRTAHVVLAILLYASAACSRRPDAYVIGAAGPQTLAYGIQNQRGIELAVSEINHDGGINGVPIRIVKRDDHASGSDAARIAGEFVANSDIIAVIGHAGSGAEVSAAHVYDAGRLPAVATTPSSPDITGISPWVFRMSPSDSVNGVTLARFASSLADSLHRAPRVAILYHNDSYGRGLSDAFLHSFTGTVISDDPVGSTTDLEPYITFFKTQTPDVVFVASDEDLGIRILREARRQHLGTTFLGGDGWQGVVSEPASEGTFIGTPFTAQDPSSRTRQFANAFRARFGMVPDAHAALAYDATRLVARALRNGATTRSKIRDYLASLDRSTAFASLSGPTWFDRTDPVGDTFRLTRVQSGLMVPVAAR